MRVRELTSLGVRTQLVELMFSALPSIVLIVCGHIIAGVTAWSTMNEPLALSLTAAGALIGLYRVVLCLAFARRDTSRDSWISLARWTNLYTWGGVAYSLSLAALTGYTIHLSHTEAAMLCLTVSMCYTVGMIIRVAVVPKAAQLQLITLLVPIGIVAASQREPINAVLALLLAMFWLGGVQLIRHMHHTVVRRLDAEQQLARMAFRDHLTGLPNRSMFELEGEELRARVYALGQSLVVAAIDLDGFKQVNDTLGHGAGDLVLQAAARCMSEVLGEAHLLARLGGDEFAIIFKNGTVLAEAQSLGERLIDALRQPVEIESKRLNVSASIGIAATARLDVSLATLMRRADQELYHAKAAGKNRVCARTDDEFPVLPPPAWHAVA